MALAGGDCLGLRLLRRVVPVGFAGGGRARPRPRRWSGSELLWAVRFWRCRARPAPASRPRGRRLIRALLDAGLRVGITALSHAVIGNLLGKVERPALQKCERGREGAIAAGRVCQRQRLRGRGAGGRHPPPGRRHGVAVGASRHAESVDVLIVDEAGQFSLANAVAVAGAATSMVLLGDPQQLAQPSQAEHPHGAGVSALEHLLDGHPTVPPDRGIFLDTTWRMHPAITDFVSQNVVRGSVALGWPGWSGSGSSGRPAGRVRVALAAGGAPGQRVRIHRGGGGGRRGRG